jgi:hypothetical protein
MLWNLTEPRCPECGAGFDLRDYRFAAGEVAFACPKCGHRHGGTGEYGHPTEADQCVCRGCGELIETVDMQVLLLGDVGEAEPAKLTPWERRGTLGFWRGWFRTIAMGMFQPAKLGGTIGPWTEWRHAFGFAGISGVAVAIVLWLLGSAAFFINLMLLSNAGGGAPTPAMTWLIRIARVQWTNSGVVTYMVLALIPLTFVTHGTIRIAGLRHGGVTRTAAAVCYASGPLVLAAIPIFGVVIAFVWFFASSIVVLSRAQQVSLGRAALAVFALPAGVVPVAVLLYRVMVAW